MSRHQKPSDLFIERAVEIWCRLLGAPKHDNGDTSLPGAFAGSMAGDLADMQIAKVADYPAAIERFRTILTDKIKYSRDHEGETNPSTGHPFWFDWVLSCDYNPNTILAEAANEAGVPLSAFSWKTDVVMGLDHASERVGYGAAAVYHYRMPSGNWLICQLRGEDMPKIIEAVDSGNLPGFTVERLTE